MPYFGGKQTLAAAIAALLPAHEHYVEPYGGSLAVLLAKSPSRMETVNDLDQRLMTFWRVLRERPGDLASACELTPHSRAEFLKCSDLDADPVDQLETARRVWVRLTQGRGGSQRRTGWRFYVDPAGSGTSFPGYLDGYVSRMPPAARRLKGVSLECRPALEIIEQYGVEPNGCLYVDPPYLATTRAARQYLHEMGDEASHRQLAGALRNCRASVVLSAYDSPLYDDLYGDWHRLDLPAFTGQAGTYGARTEVLWSNRPLGGEQPGLWEAAG
jgi:DNA adenine methylase